MNKTYKIIETTYEDDSYWVQYEYEGKIGYELVYLQKKPSIEVCSPYLKQLIMNCLHSESEMWFVELDDEEYQEKIKDPNFLSLLKAEVTNLKLDDYIIFNEDEAYITVYGGVITRFLF